MTQMQGMIVQDVRTLATQLNSAAEEIERLMNTLTTTINNTMWAGNDRERFLGDWTSSYAPQLKTIAGGLQGAATRAFHDADEQERISS